MKADQQKIRGTVTDALAALMSADWAEAIRPTPIEHPAAALRSVRRAKLAARFPGEILVVPSGGLRTRSNDVTFRFRPGTEFTWLVGSKALNAVLVIDASGGSTLYQAGPYERDDPGWFTDYRGERADGPRPHLDDVSLHLGIKTKELKELEQLCGQRARVLPGFDPEVEQMFCCAQESELATWLAEARLIKDDWEIEQIQDAVDATVRGFADVVRTLPRAVQTSERWIEGIFQLRARLEGNDVGYSSVCASGAHACTLHWIDNDGPVHPGDLILLDMGVENGELYTADVTRTLPVSGTFTPRQRRVYELVLEAQEAALATLAPGVPFDLPYDAAMAVLAQGLEDLGILPDASVTLQPTNLTHVRWTAHRISHMLGLDVRDCSAARDETYFGGALQVGHVLTIEPGLYFRPDDLLVPEDLRGMGIRIEDDVVITATGYRMLTAELPRQPDQIEAWMRQLREPRDAEAHEPA